MGVLAGKPLPLIVMRVPVGPFGGETLIAGVVAAALALAGMSRIRKQSRPEATDKQAPNFKGVDRTSFDGVMSLSASTF
jgi:hypothetical protein